MTVAAKPVKNQQRGEGAIELRVAAKLENLAVLRTLVGAVGTFEDLDFDAVVTECATPRNAELKQPRPLQAIVSQDGTARLYNGRHFIELR